MEVLFSLLLMIDLRTDSAVIYNETHTKYLLEDRASELPHYLAECQGNIAQV